MDPYIVVDNLRELVRNRHMLDPLGQRQKDVEIAQEDILKKVAMYLKKHGNEGVTDNIVLSFWDFAGQEIYYATHQVFDRCKNTCATIMFPFNFYFSKHVISCRG